MFIAVITQFAVKSLMTKAHTAYRTSVGRGNRHTGGRRGERARGVGETKERIKFLLLRQSDKWQLVYITSQMLEPLD
jgi:hypothetical protein